MKVLGIIAEYNPFHNGHLYQLQKSIEAVQPDFTVAVMSGNFTQRGEPAIFSKWLRAEAAVKCGIDLVIELPFAFACNNAEYFAYGAVDILERLGCVTHLSFGSESGDIEQLKKAAEFLAYESDEFKSQIKLFSDAGMSYPKARQEALSACLGEETAALIASPNNILAVEYLKQLTLKNSDIIPVTVKRYKANYHDSSLDNVQNPDNGIQNIASATAIRQAVASQIAENTPNSSIAAFMPSPAADMLKQSIKAPADIDTDLYKILSAKILSTDSSQLKQIFSVSEGLENKLKEAVRTANSLNELKENLISKRYTATRINRILIHLLTDFKRDKFQQIRDNKENYARLLAFNQKGAALVKAVKNKETASLPIITNVNKEADLLLNSQNLFSYDTLSADLYNLLTDNNIYEHSDNRKKPFFLK